VSMATAAIRRRAVLVVDEDQANSRRAKYEGCQAEETHKG
jgi:hypothetical protein